MAWDCHGLSRTRNPCKDIQYIDYNICIMQYWAQSTLLHCRYATLLLQVSFSATSTQLCCCKKASPLQVRNSAATSKLLRYKYATLLLQVGLSTTSTLLCYKYAPTLPYKYASLLQVSFSATSTVRFIFSKRSMAG